MNWAQLGRMALFVEVRLSSLVHGFDKVWSGPTAESEADVSFLTLQTAAKTWVWMLRVRVRLEDGTELDCQIGMEAGRPPAKLRAMLVLHYGVEALRFGGPRDRVAECVRITELLEGRKFPTHREPRFKRWAQESRGVS